MKFLKKIIVMSYYHTASSSWCVFDGDCGDVVCGMLIHSFGVSGSVWSSVLWWWISFTMHRFTRLLPTPWMFVIISSALRIIEGVGTACLVTAIFSTIPHFFPKSVGMIMVCYFMHNWFLVIWLFGCWQGLFELSSGSGYTLGPSIGGILYEVHSYIASRCGKILVVADHVVWWVSTAVPQFWWCCALSYDSKWLSDQESVWVTWLHPKAW